MKFLQTLIFYSFSFTFISSSSSSSSWGYQEKGNPSFFQIEESGFIYSAGKKQESFTFNLSF